MSKQESSFHLIFSTVLFVEFLVLKLTGLIAWSWWWVTAPLWIPAAFAIVVIGTIVMIAAVAAVAST